MAHFIKRCHAFLLGMVEFRLSWTTSYEDDELMGMYDQGRDFAHRVTLRHFDQD